eukprot:gnl/TRDRNA2_/TRDRNA2_173916_c0_seq2.p1 gnl/TRDRNA2_/TRDRNA2_173916_c0~~gnl/TRDRNA2_/TRDRNA2_173916_c0_seq2.p1  ORF type:complete len:303 (+),score=33.46 gnl/TRDRNA2_/TRDRNA2_173916_c0_seq2:69-977(+)
MKVARFAIEFAACTLYSLVVCNQVFLGGAIGGVEVEEADEGVLLQLRADMFQSSSENSTKHGIGAELTFLPASTRVTYAMPLAPTTVATAPALTPKVASPQVTYARPWAPTTVVTAPALTPKVASSPYAMPWPTRVGTAPALTPIVASPACYTISSSSGGVAGLPCRFPFAFNGIQYNYCTTTSWSTLWCGTIATVIAGSTSGWGACASSCPNLPVGTTAARVTLDPVTPYLAASLPVSEVLLFPRYPTSIETLKKKAQKKEKKEREGETEDKKKGEGEAEEKKEGEGEEKKEGEGETEANK